MLARVPSIPQIDLVREAPHPRTWAIVLTGDDSPVDGRLSSRPRQAAQRWAVAPSARRAGALERASRLVPPGQMVTVVTRRHAGAWDAQLADLPGARRLVQPAYRGRAVEMLLPLLRIARRDPSATVVVLPAEHGIDHEARFLRYVSRAVWAVALRPDVPIVIGAHPHAPVRDGWIEPGAPVDGLEELAVHSVKRFVDGASALERRRLFEGNALTSTLVFVGRAGTLRAMAARALPEVMEALEPLEDAFDSPVESLLCEAVYECMPEADLGGLQRAPELAVLPLPDVVWRSPDMVLRSPERERDAVLLAS
jgi:mannose-1-phosphate guanylyltransferase